MPQAPMRPHRGRGDYIEASIQETTSPVWGQAVETFLGDARSRHCSPATIGNYRTYLSSPRTQQFLRDYRIRVVADVTPDKLRAFQSELLDAGLSAGTAATFHRILRNFLGFCRRKSWGVGAEALEVAPPHQVVVAPETYTEAEEQHLIEAARTGRDRCIVEFMLRTGLRLSEVATVTLDDIGTGSEGPYVRVPQGNERADRVVPLDTGTFRFSHSLNAYVRNVRRAETKDRHLFLSTRRDRVTGEFGPLGVQGIKVLLRRIGQDTGIHVHAHKFRDTFASRALEAGVDPLMLQRALGHSTSAMVNRYAHFQDRNLVDARRARPDVGVAET